MRFQFDTLVNSPGLAGFSFYRLYVKEAPEPRETFS